MKVRFGFTVGPEADAQAFTEIVDHLERLRFDSIWIPEAILQPTLDPLVALAYAASRTERLGIGTHLILPGRHPVQLARQLAHLDHLSDGRLLLLGVLGLPDEADAGVQGIERRRRGAAMEEMVPLLRRLWAGETVDHDGEFHQFSGATVAPLPVQQPLELWLAGQVDSALDRCARLGDGWMPGFVAPEVAVGMRERLEATAEAAGRAMDSEHYGINLFYATDALPTEVAERLNARRGGDDVAAAVPIGWNALRERVDQWLEVGFSKFLLRPLVQPTDWETELEVLAEEMLPLTT